MEKLLLKVGFKRIRQKGSHVFYKHPDGRYTTVPHHGVRVLARPLIKEILKVMKENGYIGDFKKLEDGKGGYIKINLLGMINKCSVIKPRYNLKSESYEKFEKRYLPAKDVGIIFVSTTKGIMTHYDAKKKSVGGRLIGYCY